jgi:hypothetical protein
MLETEVAYNHGGPDVIDLARLNARNAVGAISTSLVSMAYSGYKAVRGPSSEGGGFLRGCCSGLDEPVQVRSLTGVHPSSKAIQLACDHGH